MRNTVVVLLLCLSALVLGLFLGTRAGHFLEPNEMVRDTVVVRDTIRVPEPYPVKEYVVRVDTLLWTDTLRFDDTVFVEIPAQTAERTTVDSVSHLENEYAMSDAKINNDGTLYHDLRTKPQQKPVPIEKPVEHKDSIIYRDKVIEKVVPVEKELTKWQKTQMRGFWIVSVILFVVVFRKPLLNLIRRFI